MKNLIHFFSYRSTVLVVVLTVLVHVSRPGFSQQIDWVVYDTVSYSLNPAFSSIPAAVGPDKSLSTPFLSQYALSFDQYLYGNHSLRTIDSTGNLLHSNLLGPKATIKSLRYKSNGHLIVSGAFMDTLAFNGSPLFPVNQSGQFVRNAFLLCIDGNGALLWSRNVSLNHPGLEMIDADAIDHNGNYWYANMDASNLNSAATCIGSFGQDSLSYPLPSQNMLLSDMAFDAVGAMYLAGGTGSGSFSFAGLPVVITPIYNRYLAKLDASGAGRWFYTADDITIQRHQIALDDSANIYFTGTLSDSLTMGGYFMNGPNWVHDFLTAKFDSSGNLLWARDVPQGTTITGDLRLSNRQSIVADAAGYYQFTAYRGLVDYGNGQVVGASPPSTNYGASLLRFDTQGNLQWNLDIPTTYGIYPFSVVNTSGGGYLVGTASGSQTIGNVSIPMPSNFSFFTWAARFSNSVTTSIPEILRDDLPFVFPNPSFDGKIITAYLVPGEQLSIFDLNGSLQLTITADQNTGIIETGLASGLYLVRRSDGKVQRWAVVR